MEIKPHYFAFEILESMIDQLYYDLHRSSLGIFTLVRNELQLKGIYNTQTSNTILSNNIKEFEVFQEILRNQNNVIYFNSLLLGSYSIFEVAFKEICEFVSEYSCSQKKFIAPNRDILKNCRKYLAESENLNFSNNEMDSKYNYLMKISKVRNLIAHENANLIKDKSRSLEQQEKYKEFKAMKELTILQNGQTYINTEAFIHNFIEESQSFIGLIINQLKKNQP